MTNRVHNALPAAGTPAPDFTLPSTSGTDVTLSRLRGKNVLLAFFPLAFTKVCTQEMCSLTDDYGRFRDANTEVPLGRRGGTLIEDKDRELLAQLEKHQRSV